MGTGSHLHRLIKQYLHQDYKPGCNCRELVEKMDNNPPQWSRDNMPMILEHLRAEAKTRHWVFKAILAVIPGCNAPLRWLVRQAIQAAEDDLKGQA